MRLPLFMVTLVVGLLSACDDTAPTATPEPEPALDGKADRATGIAANWKPRVLSTWLHLDLSDRSGEASVWFEPTGAKGKTVSLEAGGLQVDEVWDDRGPLPFEVKSGVLNIRHDAATGPVHVFYRFGLSAQGEGYAKNGSTVLWPYYCGNLFPCRSAPDDGITFELEVSGYGRDKVAIYPEAMTFESPSYTLALAVGSYTCRDLGKTGQGTKVSVCWLPRGKTKALTGTRALTKAFDWLEKNLGRYRFGKHVASIAANWGEASAGGMEHHPFWHVATSEMDEPVTHVHEAVHGWFGTGVRIACWEDFVLSEGTTTYLAARALGAVTDADTEEAIWESYREELELTLEDEDIIAWPSGCNRVDILKDGLFSNIVYMKGAFFWREVADNIGPETLDAVLSRFYEARVGTAAKMSELVDAVRRDTGFDPGPLVQKWLLSRGNPLP